MLTTSYQQMKPVIVNLLSLSKDAIHIHVGFLVLILTLIFSKKRLYQWQVLVPCFLISLVMEGLDLWDEFVTLGRLHFTASLHDILNTNFIPLLLVLWFRKEHQDDAKGRKGKGFDRILNKE